ncbi:MAG: DUF1587 domain-containing protein, partial [Planctomycetota bacterium]
MKTKGSMRLVVQPSLVVGIVFALLTMPNVRATELQERSAPMATKHRVFFQTHCYDCHDSVAQEAGVDLESLSFNISQDMETAGLWQKVLNAINSGEMPPQDYGALPDDKKLAFLEDLTPQMVRARRILSDSKGVIPLRRLNRREYANTIESLLGVRPDVSLLPNDQTGAGFDTQGASLFMSSDQIEQYLEAARHTLDLCFTQVTSDKNFKKRAEAEDQLIPRNRAYYDNLVSQLNQANAYLNQNEKPPSSFGLIDEYQVKKYVAQHESYQPIFDWYFSRPENKHGGSMIMIPKNLGMARVQLAPAPANAPGRYAVRVRVGHYPGSEDRYQYLELSALRAN